MNFIKLNNNPKGLKACDCVVRAIALATNKSWDDVYLALSQIGFETKRAMNEKPVYQKYLSDLGWAKLPMPRRVDKTRFTVKEFVDEILPKIKNKVIISIAHHLTVVGDGNLYDAFDCSYKSVGNYFTKE